MNKKRNTLLFLLCTLAFTLFAQQPDADFEIFKKNYRETQTLVPTQKDAQLKAAIKSYSPKVFNMETGEPLASLAPNDYAKHRTYWNHIYNLATLYGYGREYPQKAALLEEYTGNADVLKLIIKSVNWYFDNDMEITQQKYHQTYTYHASGPVIVTMDYILATLYPNVIRAQEGSDAARAFDAMLNFGDYELDSGYQVNGANWSFRVFNHCFRHVYVSNDPYRMNRLRRAINKGLHPVVFEKTLEKATDGFYPDGMIFHHGEMCYFTMYGKEMVDKHVEMNHFLKDTRWAYTDEEWNTLAFLFWEGVRHGMYRGNPEYSTGPKRASELANRIEWAPAQADIVPREILKYAKGRTEYDERLATWLENFDATPDFTESDKSLVELDEHKYYWTGDYQVHRRNDYYIATRRSSLRARAPEDAGTNDGHMHLHYGSGYTPILVRGDEYRVARIGWNWLALPGTTNEMCGTVTSGKAGSRKRNNTAFAGGVQENKYGVGGFIYNVCEANYDTKEWVDINGAYAKKSNFYFDEGMLALGSNIHRKATIGGEQADIVTTLDQKRSETPTYYAEGRGRVRTIAQTKNTHLSLNVKERAWFWHDGVGYIIYAPQKGERVAVELTIEMRPLNPVLRKEKEGWNQVYQPGLTPEEDKNQEILMWQLGINHGKNPADAQYTYVVLPNVTKEETARYCAKPRFTVETLTNEAHVVRHSDLEMYQGVFYQAGTATLANGGSLTAERPLVMQMRPEGDNLVVTAQNPEAYMPCPSLVKPDMVANGYIGVQLKAPVTLSWEGLQGFSNRAIDFTFSQERNYEGAFVSQTVVR